ncbi:Gfo/Idh/MocA family protein [Zophobihabitans entericus]|uniref:Gfo/Idh/MocA family oxidoreductase n=1 Tax=Zophobihabitans entericus TaxID=1635327 RepID=A0A6G9IA80_9GAMM|nr:Gfo/Idh/MocA family oxidoreductase [Zophobihabitans entericus]QIQ21131.1 Gfo/Idh/MocA family oxidoreductase [Zophobihabitans entericus]
MANTRIVVVGAGLIGKRHIEAVNKAEGVEMSAIIEPMPSGKEVAGKEGLPLFQNLTDLLKAKQPVDAVILATPNALHVPGGLECIEAGLPVLVEKPLAESVEAGRKLVEAGEKAGIPVLTGHHRRYNPLIARARKIVKEDQRLGKLTIVNGMCWFLKGDDYFDVAWRKQKGGGPILINLVHVIDDLRNIAGDIESVQAISSNGTRNHEVEDTAAILIRFTNGALGTLSISDCAAAPWSWELTANENPAYPYTDQSCYLFAGTHGSLAVPNNQLWRYADDKRGWWQTIYQEKQNHPVSEDIDPLIVQAAHLGAVVRGEAEPIMTGREGLRSLEATFAVKESAENGGKIIHLKN